MSTYFMLMNVKENKFYNSSRSDRWAKRQSGGYRYKSDEILTDILETRARWVNEYYPKKIVEHEQDRNYGLADEARENLEYDRDFLKNHVIVEYMHGDESNDYQPIEVSRRSMNSSKRTETVVNEYWTHELQEIKQVKM